MFTIGERYRVVAPSPLALIEPVPFYGTCNSIEPIPYYKKCVQIGFVNVMDKFGKPLQNVWITFDGLKSIPNWKIMKVMNPELTQEIQTHYSAPSLANLCKKHISDEIRIEYQGTFIGDILI